MCRADYEITIEGHLDQGHWARWFEGLTIRLSDEGRTRLVGSGLDQAGLHGLLVQIRDLGLPLVALRRLEGEASQANRDEREDNQRTPREGGKGRGA